MAGLELISDEEARGEKTKVWKHPSGSVFVYHRLLTWERVDVNSTLLKDERTGQPEEKLFVNSVCEQGLVSWENIFFDGKEVEMNPDTISRLPLGVRRQLQNRIWGDIDNDDPFLS